MPGFIKTPKDEARWSKAKKAASKSTSEGSDGYWALSNYIYHRMGKSEDDIQKAEAYKILLKSLFISPSSALTKTKISIPNATKMPKPKAMGKITDKPSKFFKSEEFPNIKRTSIEKLRSFLEHTRTKNKV